MSQSLAADKHTEPRGRDTEHRQLQHKLLCKATNSLFIGTIIVKLERAPRITPQSYYTVSISTFRLYRTAWRIMLKFCATLVALQRFSFLKLWDHNYMAAMAPHDAWPDRFIFVQIVMSLHSIWLQWQPY